MEGPVQNQLDKKPQSDTAALVQSCPKQKGTHVILQLPTHEALTKAIGTAIDSRPTPSGAREVARTELYKALELLDGQAITYRLAPKNTPEITGDRSNTTPFWQRMGELKTTQGTYNGPIYRANGRKCRTVQDLDQAMIDTRSFWEESTANPSQLAAHTPRISSGQQPPPALSRTHHCQDPVPSTTHQRVGARA